MTAQQQPREEAGDTGKAVEIELQQIVYILPGAHGGYSVYLVSEGSTSDGERPFSLRVAQGQEHELPDGFQKFILERGNLPPQHLRAPRELNVVVSTHSGLRLAESFYQEVLQPLLGAVGLAPHKDEGRNDGYKVVVTKNQHTLRDFSRALGKDPKVSDKTVVLLSGDGGVVDLLNGLDHSSAPSAPTIALLPLGTGNALFHSLHKPHYSATPSAPSHFVLALRSLFLGTTSPLPVFRASFSQGATLVSAPVEHDAPVDATTAEAPKDHEKETPVTHLLGAIVASYGFHASLVWESDTPAYRVHGAKRFGMAAAELLKVEHAYDAAVEVRRTSDEASFVPVAVRGKKQDEQSGSQSNGFNYVLATLVSNLEKTFTISPASRPLDGQLRLVHFGDVGGARTMEIMTAAYAEGDHVKLEDVGYEAVEEVKVTVNEEDPRWRKVCIDGSIVELEKGGWMSVAKEGRERLRVLIDV
ncbi:uncharacterized protein C8A04DRAFT_29020 [Dichotomopilus funicola]|uniref:DAGKc domain-containing protein n=1 Tax=Dichotomopilus funicola TaxID=1934379 RepID=A0AAN6ZL79_9PEZI|nr:hypothetical protein C8A04DRAFT_29020 [Dichotomopilus funicola]